MIWITTNRYYLETKQEVITALKDNRLILAEDGDVQLIQKDNGKYYINF